MAIQIGTVDGRINISEEKIRILINAIKAFDNSCIAKAKTDNIALGKAFQRFVEPVYNDPNLKFDINTISVSALTKTGKVQSPSHLTYCKKMGLLEMDEAKEIFQLTPLGKALYENDITISDYAIILLSKMGIFIDDKYVDNLMVLLSEYYKTHPVANENQLKNYILEKYKETDFVKTRIDIILAALSTAGLLNKLDNGGYCLNDIPSSQILNTFIHNKDKIEPALKDNNPNYTEYMGSMQYGVFDIVNRGNEHLFRIKHPDIFKFISVIPPESNKGQNINLLEVEKGYNIYIEAIKTKPFLLLAGISGTGKSRIVRELAFKSCPPYLRDKEGTSPGNYCMIEVKPNWYDSTEVLGYYSNLNERYRFTKFVRFLVKAKMFPDVPFFLCLDEMNLAPVEQYFAEILSILETRKHPKKEDGAIDMDHIQSGVIIEPKYFQEDINPGLKRFVNADTGESYAKSKSLTDWEIYLALNKPTEEELAKQSPVVSDEIKNSKTLSEHGLTLPDNVIIIGTVNMDDTTHQFSRKVIDRAMTIEMNGGKLKSMFGGSKKLEYIDDKDEQEKWQQSFRQPFVNADEVVETYPIYAEEIIEKLPKRIEEINQALKGTPFEVSYRVLNELTVMVGIMLENKSDSQSFDDILDKALDNILLMKVLPRIEGDSDMFNIKDSQKSRLHLLLEVAPDIKKSKVESTNEDSEEENTQNQELRQTAKEKITEMIERLNNQEFTRFWP